MGAACCRGRIASRRHFGYATSKSYYFVRGDLRQLAATLNIPLKRWPGACAHPGFFVIGRSHECYFGFAGSGPTQRVAVSARARRARAGVRWGDGDEYPAARAHRRGFRRRDIRGMQRLSRAHAAGRGARHPRVVPRRGLRRGRDVHVPEHAAAAPRVGVRRQGARGQRGCRPTGARGVRCGGQRATAVRGRVDRPNGNAAVER